MIIEGSKVIGYMYDTEYEQFFGSSREEAERKFEAWINSNTQYRGICMYAKHKGYHFYYITENGKRYSLNGYTWSRVDEYRNVWKVDSKEIVM